LPASQSRSIAVPPATVETLPWFLSEVSPRTVAAMQHFVHLPDLF
jgi:hypothetical protein